MVKKILENGSRLFSKKQSTILSAATVLMVAVLLSRILGLLRDRLLAANFFSEGEQWQLDVYFAAFRIPDMIFQLLVLGALSAAFIPVYSSYLEKNKNKAGDIANGIINLACIAYVFLAVLIFAFSGSLSRIIAPEFDFQQTQLMVQLTRIMLLAQFFFIISNFFTGILQSNQHFIVPALAPIMYNVGIIVGIIFFSPALGIYGPTLGVVLGAFLHLFIQWPLIKKIGFIYKPSLGLNLQGVRQIGKLMIPRTLALAVNQIELTVAVFLSSAMASGSLSIFYFAQHLQSLPVGLFGLTIGQAALPMLSRELGFFKRYEQFKNLFLSSFKQILYFSLPASVLLLVLRIPLVRIAFGAKEFPWEATILTGKVVAAFSISVAALAVIQLLIRAFYALQDTKTPLIVGAVSVLINVLFSFLFTKTFDMGVVGLGYAISTSSIIQAILLFILLSKKLNGFNFTDYLIPFIKMLISSILTGIALWVPMRLLDKFVLDTTKTIDLVILTVVATGTGFMVYIIFSIIFQIEEFNKFLKILDRFGSWKKVFTQSEEVLSQTSASPVNTNQES